MKLKGNIKKIFVVSSTTKSLNRVFISLIEWDICDICDILKCDVYGVNLLFFPGRSNDKLRKNADGHKTLATTFSVKRHALSYVTNTLSQLGLRIFSRYFPIHLLSHTEKILLEHFLAK